MTMAEERIPAFIDVSAGFFNRHPGRMLAEVAAGGVVRITDRRMGIVKGYLTAELPAGLEPVADLIPGTLMRGGLPRPPEGFRHCSGCNRDLPATPDEFHRDAEMSGGLHSTCKRCCKEAADRRHGAESETTR
jgi:hypothetical protein